MRSWCDQGVQNEPTLVSATQSDDNETVGLRQDELRVKTGRTLTLPQALAKGDLDYRKLLSGTGGGSCCYALYSRSGTSL